MLNNHHPPGRLFIRTILWNADTQIILSQITMIHSVHAFVISLSGIFSLLFTISTP